MSITGKFSEAPTGNSGARDDRISRQNTDFRGS